MLTNITGKPGALTTYVAQPRELFYSSRADAKFLPGPLTVDGTLSGNATNAPYTWLLFAGMPVGRVTSTGKYATSLLGATTSATAASATTVQTDVNTAAEIVRRIGTTGTFKLTGPPAADGTVATQVVTYSAVNTGTGAITCSAASAAAVSGSLIQPTDGSEVIITLIADTWGLKVIDALNSTRLDVFDPELWAGGGIVNTGMIVNYPADPSLKAWLKSSIRTLIADAKFQDDLVNT
jgi:hypothetical protein